MTNEFRASVDGVSGGSSQRRLLRLCGITQFNKKEGSGMCSVKLTAEVYAIMS